MTGAYCALEPAALSAADWEVVFQQTLLFADYQIRRVRWRHEIGGVLPGGFDPESIANQAIMDFLQQSPESASEHDPQRHLPSKVLLTTEDKVLLTAEDLSSIASATEDHGF